MANCPPGLLKLVILLASITPDYLLEEDKSNNCIQITARDDSTSGLCIFTQNESGNKINLHLTTPKEKEYWEVGLTPLKNIH